MNSPKIPNTLKRLARQLFEDEADQERFITSVTEPVEYSVAIVWLSDRPADSPFQALPKPGWMPSYVDLVSIDERPGKHSLHQQGAYYCLDPSSVFMGMGVSAVNSCQTLLDMCASPGGKSVMAWRALRPDWLWANEVIGKRSGALISNLKRCNIGPANVISIDSAKLADAAIGFDLVIVDAPCSGQSLVARGKESPGCFHPATININANRQRRILSNSVKTVNSGGCLIYMTCTYSLKENERNVDWLLKKNPEFESVSVDAISAYQSSYSSHHCYRIWPMGGEGAGGFVAVLQRTNATEFDAHGCLDDLPVRWSSELLSD